VAAARASERKGKENERKKGGPALLAAMARAMAWRPACRDAAVRPAGGAAARSTEKHGRRKKNELGF